MIRAKREGGLIPPQLTPPVMDSSFNACMCYGPPEFPQEFYGSSHHSNAKRAPKTHFFIPKDVVAFNTCHCKETPEAFLGLQLALIYLLRKSWVLQKLPSLFQESSQSWQEQTAYMLQRLSCLFHISCRTGANLKTQAWSKLPKKYRYTWDLTHIHLLLSTEVEKLWRSINTGNNSHIYASLIFIEIYFPTYPKTSFKSLYFTVDISRKSPQAVTLKSTVMLS